MFAIKFSQSVKTLLWLYLHDLSIPHFLWKFKALPSQYTLKYLLQGKCNLITQEIFQLEVKGRYLSQLGSCQWECIQSLKKPRSAFVCQEFHVPGMLWGQLIIDFPTWIQTSEKIIWIEELTPTKRCHDHIRNKTTQK